MNIMIHPARGNSGEKKDRKGSQRRSVSGKGVLDIPTSDDRPLRSTCRSGICVSPATLGSCMKGTSRADGM